MLPSIDDFACIICLLAMQTKSVLWKGVSQKSPLSTALADNGTK